MKQEKWEKIKEIFNHIFELNEDEREAVLERECKDDPEIKNEIKALLSAHQQTNNFLEKNILFTDEEENDQLIGKIFRSYKIEKRIASGGMASIYLASRSDEQFRKKVAIKFIKKGMDTEEIIERFKLERNALASLDHPNIAKILDGGTTNSDLPFFIMEYVEGIPVDEYCIQNNLSIKEILKIFLQICTAVHYAHQNLIIHRDIKPGNILITKDGIPKLLDFGIAKILGESDGDYNRTIKYGSKIMTLEYASPEQVKGGRITTATDIYSLGILLYELLTWKKPYIIQNNIPFEAEKIIATTKPVKPSSAVKNIMDEIEHSPHKLNLEKAKKLSKELKGDLDNIILMSLKKDPERRYSSVKEFSEDIQKYLTGLPVIAHRDSFQYRAKKFLVRHKAAAVITFFILGLIVTSFILITRQSKIASLERDKAQFEAAKAEQINSFLNEMLASVDPSKSGKDVTVNEVLQNASEKVDVELKNFPDIEADIRTTIGTTYQSLGLYDEAEKHIKRALFLRDSLYGANNFETAKSFKSYGLLLHYQGKFDESKKWYEKAINTYKLIYEKPTPAYAEALNDYGTLLNDIELYDSAETVLRESLKIYRMVRDEGHMDIASTLNNLALVLHFKNELEEAEKLYRESLELNYKLFGEEYPQISYNINNLAFVMHDRGNHVAAESLFTKAYNLRSRLLGKDHPEAALILFNLGSEKSHLKKYEEAENYIIGAINVWKSKFSPGHPYFGRAYYWLGKVYNETNRFNEAEKYLRTALKIRQKIMEEDNPTLIINECELSKSLIKQGKYKEVEKILLKKFEIVKNHNEMTPAEKNYFKEILNELFVKTGDKEKAALYLSSPK